MTVLRIMKKLDDLDKMGCYLFKTGDLATVLGTDEPKNLSVRLNRLVKQGVLHRLTKGLYINPNADMKERNPLEDMVAYLRPNHINYVSLECALNEHGLSEQVPAGVLTVMTTGRSGVFETPYGTLELTHTAKSSLELLNHLNKDARTLHRADPELTVKDLTAVGRATSLLHEGYLKHVS